MQIVSKQQKNNKGYNIPLNNLSGLKTQKIKIILLDIETSPWEALCYGTIWEPIVIKLKTYTQILSFSYRIVGEKKSHYIGQNSLNGYKAGKLNDKNLMIEISKIIKDADFIVAHNGDAFDWKIIKERVLFHRLPPLPEIKTLDTKKLIKSVSKLPSNKLTHVSVFLGNGDKLKHNGTDLFIDCMNGDPKAWKVNEKYNKKDVDIMYDDFIDMLPYVKLPNIYIRFKNNLDINCSNPLCLSSKLIKTRLRRVVNGWKQQYQCSECGRYTQDTRLIKK